MRARDLPWRELSGPAVALAAAVVLVAATGYVAQEWLDRREQAFRDARQALAQAASQYRNASDDQAVYAQYATRFREIRERGWIGREQRLSWIEALQTINRELDLAKLRYDIARQKRLDLGAAGSTPAGLALYGTPMEVTMEALHEGDVLTLLDRLRGQGKGLMALRGCRLELARTDGRIRMAAEAANIAATCTLHWYSLRIERNAGGSS